MWKPENYNVIYFYSFEDECYLARIIELPGCVSDGKTVEEAVKNVRELAKDWIEITEEAGENVPEPQLTELPHGDRIGIMDVAKYIYLKMGGITTKALQKLLYYCKAWSCGWYGEALFPERFEAWVGGPINRKLFGRHRGMRLAKGSIFAGVNTHDLSEEQKQFVDTIISQYDPLNPDELGEMTHKEDPWVKARKGIPDDEKSGEEISDSMMIEYYGKGKRTA